MGRGRDEESVDSANESVCVTDVRPVENGHNRVPGVSFVRDFAVPGNVVVKGEAKRHRRDYRFPGGHKSKLK